MSAGVLNDLHKAVITTCDQLYANRQLITKKIVREIIQKLGTWSDQELELQLPNYVNAWRLHNMSTSIDSTVADRITELEAQLCKYRANLHQAQQTINKLKAELLAESSSSKMHRTRIIDELRNMLGESNC